MVNTYLAYPPGAGGNFLCWLIHPDKFHKITNNEYRPNNIAKIKNTVQIECLGLVPQEGCDNVDTLEVGVDFWDNGSRFLRPLIRYGDLYKSHCPTYEVPDSTNIFISSRDDDIRRYCNILAYLKIKSNRPSPRIVSLEKFVNNFHDWESFESYKYIPYEQIFFDLDLDDTLWSGCEAQVAEYTANNIRLLHEYGYSTFIPKR